MKSNLTLLEIELLSRGPEFSSELAALTNFRNTWTPEMREDLRGRRFGKLKVRQYVGENSRRQPCWCCVCDCGNVVRIAGLALLGSRTGQYKTKSCGCLNYGEDAASRNRKQWNKLPDRIKEKILSALHDPSVKRAGMFQYSMDGYRAAEELGVPHERIVALAGSGVLRSKWRKGELWVSSADVAELLATQKRAKKRCRQSDEMMGIL